MTENKKERYKVVWFKVAGYNIEGMVTKEHKGWVTIKTFISGNLYRRKKKNVMTRSQFESYQLRSGLNRREYVW